MLKRIFKITNPYFGSREGKRAIFSIIGIILFEFLFIYLSVLLNNWSNQFYNALQDFAYDKFKESLVEWLVLVALLIIVFIVKLFLSYNTQLKWRKWLVTHFIDLWLENRAFYGIKIMGYETDNPDQRITNDIQSFIGLLLSLGIGILSAIVSIITFTAVLWRSSTLITVEVWRINIPIIMVVAFLYAILSTIMMHKIGRPMARLFFDQEFLEANLRYSMMRLREYAEPIAFYNIIKSEHWNLLRRLKAVIKISFLRNILHIKLSTFINFYANIATIMPILISAPFYFAKTIKLGDVMQISGAFSHLNDALSWIINSYVDIALFKAVTNRLYGFLESIQSWNSYSKNHEHKYTQNQQKDLTMFNVELKLPNGELLLSIGNLDFKDCNKYVIIGPSGCGKSTMLRVISGIWPFFDGHINRPDNVVFIPQSNYIPYGNLLRAITYNQDGQLLENRVITLMERLGLQHLIDKIYHVDDWGRILSGGEKQKIAIIRAILYSPELLIMDEAISALDIESATTVLNLIEEYLPNTKVIMVSHHLLDLTKKWTKIILENKKVKDVQEN